MLNPIEMKSYRHGCPSIVNQSIAETSIPGMEIDLTRLGKRALSGNDYAMIFSDRRRTRYEWQQGIFRRNTQQVLPRVTKVFSYIRRCIHGYLKALRTLGLVSHSLDSSWQCVGSKRPKATKLYMYRYATGRFLQGEDCICMTIAP